MLAKKIDYRAYDVLERVLGQERADPFHPLNRHPMTFSDVEVGEVYGGADDGQLQAQIHDAPANVGGSRFRSWMWVLLHYRRAREELR